MEQNSEAKLLIPFDSIEDHISCSICLSVIRGAVLTPCGHRYCTTCITEWVGRNHNCPCCNHALQTTQFYSDVQFDSFVETILIERDRAEQVEFDKIFSSEAPTLDESISTKQLSPFEKILKDHMKSSLLSHQRYFDKLRSDCQRKIHMLDSGVDVDNSSQGEDKEALKTTLIQNLEQSEKLAADAYDKYLGNNLPKLDLLPVQVSVYIADKDLRIPDISIRPFDKLSVIKPIIEAAMRERSDSIVSWNNDGGGLRILFSPLSKSDQYDLTSVMSSLNVCEDVVQLAWDSQPFFQHHMRPGSEILVRGVFKSESDLPKRCFAVVFRERGAHPVDYFFCETCKLRWICMSCIQCCHKGHTVSVFVKGHTPDWACCYCPKKKKCKIEEN